MPTAGPVNDRTARKVKGDFMASDERTNSDDRQLFVTARQLAIMLRVSQQTLCEMHQAGRLPIPVSGVGAVRWRLDDALKCLSELRV